MAGAPVFERPCDTDEFAHIFERSFKAAAEHYQREKLDAFRTILVNAAVLSDVAQEEKEQLLGDRVTPLCHRLMRFVKTPTGN
jgi:hypothetical protein